MAGDLDMDDQDSAVPDLEALDLADQSLEDPDSGTVVVPDLDLDSVTGDVPVMAMVEAPVMAVAAEETRGHGPRLGTTLGARRRFSSHCWSDSLFWRSSFG